MGDGSLDFGGKSLAGKAQNEWVMSRWLTIRNLVLKIPRMALLGEPSAK
jgi:hypothetical protein